MAQSNDLPFASWSATRARLAAGHFGGITVNQMQRRRNRDIPCSTKVANYSQSLSDERLVQKGEQAWGFRQILYGWRERHSQWRRRIHQHGIEHQGAEQADGEPGGELQTAADAASGTGAG